MKVCVYGAGAIGGILAAALVKAGVSTSLIARGAQLGAITSRGLTVRDAAGERTVQVRATERPEELGTQDIVIIALKAPGVPAILDRIPVLLGESTAVVSAVNGLPWWYFHNLAGPYRDTRLAAVDPGGRQWAVIGPQRAIGCVVYPAAEVVEPGIVQVLEGDRFLLGEPSGEATERVGRLAAALRKGGLKAPVRPRIREEIWVKLWGNLCFNPISALTGGTLEQICRDPGTRALARAMMVEAEAIAGKLGITMPVSVDQRIAGAEAVGAHKTSMLQDLERGRPMEIDALVASVQEVGRLTGSPTPTIDAVLVLVQQRARLAGCYP